MTRNIIAVVGVTSAPVRGLVHAILGDRAGRFAVRVITLDVNTAPAAALAALGAELVVGHVGASVGLKSGFDGAYGAFYFRPVLNPPALQKELAEITAMAQAAKDAGLKHFIWATLGDVKTEIAVVFKNLGVPATFLHTFGNLTALRREAGGQELGRVAYGIFRSGEYIGQTVPIKAEVLIEAKRNAARDRVTPLPAPRVPAPVTAVAAPVTAPATMQRPQASPADFGTTAQESPRLAAGAPAAMQTTARVPVSTEVASVREPRRRWVRPWMVIPVIIAIALFGVEYLRKPPQRDAAASDTASLGNSAAPRPTSPVVDRIEGHGPPAPTVTSRWEQERAAARGAAAPGKLTAVLATTPPSSPKKHFRQRGRGRPRHREGAGEGVGERADEEALSAAPESSGSHESPVSAGGEIPAIDRPERPAVDSSGTARPAAADKLKSPILAAPPPGYIASKAVAATVREHAAEVRACFDRAVMERPDLHGRLTVRATVDPIGRVVSVSPTSTIEAGGRLEACVVSAFRDWAFPKPVGGVKGDITYSFSFE